MRYPIGIQTFENIRTEGYVYVDKTRGIYELTHDFKYVFLSRPRRFGKSLLLSTISAYFQGRKDLFEGLDIEKLETEWNVYPVLHLDLNIGLYNSIEGLREHLDYIISRLEREYGVESVPEGISLRLDNIIQTVYQLTGRPVVILIDEYDKPLLEAIGKPELQETFRDELRAFYGVMKSQDEHIRFAMLTGVTKFGHLSVFSGLNNITDISFNRNYPAICGMTKEEIHTYFSESLHNMAIEYECTDDEMAEKLRIMYDGYRFTKAEIKVFNPFSLLNAFSMNELGSYWFASGTPRYLAKLLTMHHYKLSNLEGESADQQRLSSMDTDSSDPIPVIYQSGYLTIKDYNRRRDRYILGLPNEEVRKGLMEYLFPFYARTRDRRMFDVDYFIDDIEDGNPKSFMERLKSLTADISYDIQANCEDDFQNLLYVIMTLCSIKPVVERCTSDGRIDMVVETDDYVYVMEFKVDGSAQAALDQINSKEYTLPWAVDHRRVFKIGANFSTERRRLTEYAIEEG